MLEFLDQYYVQVPQYCLRLYEHQSTDDTPPPRRGINKVPRRFAPSSPPNEKPVNLRTDPVRRRQEIPVWEVGIDLDGGRIPVAEQRPRPVQRLPLHDRVAGVAVPEVMEPDVIREPRLRADRAPRHTDAFDGLAFPGPAGEDMRGADRLAPSFQKVPSGSRQDHVAGAGLGFGERQTIFLHLVPTEREDLPRTTPRQQDQLNSLSCKHSTTCKKIIRVSVTIAIKGSSNGTLCQSHLALLVCQTLQRQQRAQGGQENRQKLPDRK